MFHERLVEWKAKRDAQRIIEAVPGLRLNSIIGAIDGVITPEPIWRRAAAHDAVPASVIRGDCDEGAGAGRDLGLVDRLPLGHTEILVRHAATNPGVSSDAGVPVVLAGDLERLTERSGRCCC